VNHFASPRFWDHYHSLPAAIRKLADDNFVLLKSNPQHPSLHFKKVGRFHSVRIGRKYRTVGVLRDQDIVWFWIGTHADYDQIIK